MQPKKSALSRNQPVGLGHSFVMLQPRIDLPLLRHLKQQIGGNFLIRGMVRGYVGERYTEQLHPEPVLA
ncbi:hypothetical protein PbDSM24746_52640 [Paenibacillus macerans]|nr:hypothetical protein PbDSM24746_52640 [Paenibacillus macerans]